MEVYIIHYHLNPGGVTRIIEAQITGLKSISEDVNLTVLSGKSSNEDMLHGVKALVDSALYYINNGSDVVKYAESVASIMSTITKGINDQQVLHFHNPNLGKNPSLTMAVFKLASEGYPIINHCHDFPEDRPANLALLESIIPAMSHLSLNQVMYPDFPWYHFVVLNSCDYERILQKGVPASRVHLLPNPVSMKQAGAGIEIPILRNKICGILGFDSTKIICCYPVRAIERKNLGEYLLLAALFADVAQFAVTQPPKNPVEIPQYSRWKKFCNEKGLAIKFEAGEAVNHEELIIISDFCITTSIREGFGMVYLEPWLAGTPVIGRELPCIIGDLKRLGVDFPRLYEHILIETPDSTMDFKDLSQQDQEMVIAKVINNHEFKLILINNNPFLKSLFDDIPDEIMLRNQQVIKKRFSTEDYGKELFAIYKAVSR